MVGGSRVHARRLSAFVILVAGLLPGWAQAGINQWTIVGGEGGQVFGLSWHPTRNNVILASVGQHLYRSTNGGSNWSEVASLLNGGGNFIVDPANPDRILHPNFPIYRSDDGGATFQAAAALPGNLFARQLAISSDGAVVYATGNGAVFRSTNFGQSWTERSSGLPGTAAFSVASSLYVSPQDSNVVYVSYQAEGLFRTADGGASWVRLGTAQIVRGMAINPLDPANIVIAADTGIWRSTNTGLTWTQTASGYFGWLDFDPTTPNQMVAYSISGRSLYLSADRGVNWVTGAIVNSVQAQVGAFHPTIAGKLALGTTEGVFLSNNGGQTIGYSSDGIRDAEVRSMAVSRSAPFEVYASLFAGREGVYRRTTSGWSVGNVAQLRSALQPPLVIEALAVDPNDSATVYAAGQGGVAKSTDAGSTWFLPAAPRANQWFRSVAIDPTNTQVVYTSSPTLGVLRSQNGGVTWFERNSGLPVQGADVPMGFVSLNPAVPTMLFAASSYETGPLYRTDDAGTNWSAVAGLPADHQTRSMAYDPLHPERLYVGTNAGLYRSFNSGLSWTSIAPVGNVGANTILIDPVHTNTVTVIPSGGPVGFLRSVDAGVSWENIPVGSPGEFILLQNAVIDPLGAGRYIAGGSRRGLMEYQVAPDLAVTMTGLESTMATGSQGIAAITVRNRGPYSVSFAQVDLSLPPTLSTGLATTSRGSCAKTANGIHCDLGAMHPNDIADISVPVVAGSTMGTGTVSTTVAGYEPDAVAGNNTVGSQVTTLDTADLSLTLEGNPQTVGRQGTVTLTARLMNKGPKLAFPTLLIVDLPAGLQVAAAGIPSICTLAVARLTCNFGNLPEGASATLELALVANQAGVQSVSASAQSPMLDNNVADNSASASFTVRPVSDMGVAISEPPATLQTGQGGNVSVTVTNGGADEVLVAVTTISATNLNIVSATPGLGSCSIAAGVANCSLGTMSSGSSRNIAVAFSGQSAGQATLSAVTTSEGIDPVGGNNSTSRTLSITAPAGGGAGSGGAGGGSGGGGGGSLGLSALLALLLLNWKRLGVVPV
jgi:Domain of unknown function DUF11